MTKAKTWITGVLFFLVADVYKRQVIILEKASEKDAGGNTSVSGGTMCLADPNNLDTAFEFIRYQTPDTTTDEEIEGYLEESSTLQQLSLIHI